MYVPVCGRIFDKSDKFGKTYISLAQSLRFLVAESQLPITTMVTSKGTEKCPESSPTGHLPETEEAVEWLPEHLAEKSDSPERIG